MLSECIILISRIHFCLTLQLPVGGTDSELEERIIQHLAAAAAMGRTRHIARREGQRNRSSAQGRPHYLVFSTHANGPPVASVSSSPTQSIESESASSAAAAAQPTSLITRGEDSTQIVPPPSSQADQIYASASRSSGPASNHHGTSSHNQYLQFLTLILLFFSVNYIHRRCFFLAQGKGFYSSPVFVLQLLFLFIYIDLIDIT